ncbi:hypothetical protein NL676_021982 [Syzygium grande]|nr:hypothetical protein NL676_021982 [Syzygium grande]
MLPFDMKGTWEAMEECSKLGLAKSIGVSNFGTRKLSQLLMHATIPPAVNQPGGFERMKLQIPQRRGFAGEIFVSEDGPYKSVDELWDGDA